MAVAIAVCLVTLVTAALAWRVLSERPAPAHWLRAAGPARAVAGKVLRLDVRLSRGLTPSQLVMDLHWSTRGREWQGVLVGGHAVPVGAEAETRTFEFMVPDRPELGFVIPIIYLSPTGIWSDRTRAARSDPIPVTGNTSGERQTFRVQLPIYEVRSDPGRYPALSRPLTLAVGLGWLVCGALAGRIGWERSKARSDRTFQMGGWIIVAGFSLCIAAWNWMDLERLLGWRGRLILLEHHVYGLREPAQLGSTVVATALAAGCVVGIGLARLPKGLRLIWLGLVLFAVTAIVGVISLHAVDRIALVNFCGAPRMQWVGLVSVILALSGAVRAAAEHD